MLTELKVSNFRIFDDEVTVRFRPITILIGRNSSGKSTVVKFLLMLQQSSGPGQSRFLTPEGDRVGLGAFTELKNSLTRKRQLAFELTTDQLGDTRPAMLHMRSVSDAIDPQQDMTCKISARIYYSHTSRRGQGQYSLVSAASGNAAVSIDVRTTDDFPLFDLPHVDFEMPVGALPSSDGNGNEEDQTEISLEGIEQLQEQLAAHLERLDLIRALRRQINSLRHLLPVRAEAQRVIQASSPPSDDVGQKGEYALPHLQQLVEGRREGFDFIAPHLANIAGIETIAFKSSSRYVSQAYARNKNTGADVLIADYGFGVGQCLPILVQGAIMAPFSTLMVEQPEAQLHPTAQLDLGSFFADLWNQRNVGSIIETHSGNIILRIRRLVARGELNPKDVSIAYFTLDEDRGHMPVVKNLDIQEDGSMQSGLPMEFFGADVIEGMQLGVRA